MSGKAKPLLVLASRGGYEALLVQGTKMTGWNRVELPLVEFV